MNSRSTVCPSWKGASVLPTTRASALVGAIVMRTVLANNDPAMVETMTV